MSPLLCAELAALPAITREQALAKYAARLAAMTGEQLTEERHRLEAQLPYGEAHRLANAEFEYRLAVAHLTELAVAR